MSSFTSPAPPPNPSSSPDPASSSSPARPPRPFRLRDEADLLALVPFTLGFHPEESLVVVSVDRSGRPFSARIDLPTDPDDVDVLVDQLVFPVRRSGAQHAFLVAYTGDAPLAEVAVDAMAVALETAGVRVVLQLRAHGSRWWPATPSAGYPVSVSGTPYDVRSHELTSRSVADGRVTFANRRELAASLAPTDWEQVEAVAAAYDGLGPVPRRRRAQRDEAAWLLRRVRELLAPAEQGVVLGEPVDSARLLRAVQSVEVQEVVWNGVTKADADGHVQLWRELVRSSPEELVAPPAGLLAFSAWISGHGALAWCAVERSLAADPDHRLASFVADVLTEARPPDTWVPRRRETLRLYGG